MGMGEDDKPENIMGRDYFGDQAVDGRIILKFVLGM
jgi:hypothetical protein